MAKYRVFNLGALNLKISPFLTGEGDLIQCENMVRNSIGSWSKRPGYVTFLGTADGSAVTDLFAWQRNDGTTVKVLRNSGVKLQYSTQGTGAWTTCTNGTVTSNSHIGHAVLEDTIICGQADGTTRHSSDGITFSDTTSAPAEQFFTSKFNRIWAGGTASNAFYCTAGTPSDWTTDSSSIKIPGAGKINQMFTCNDRVVAPKNSGNMFTYDDYNLRQVPTNEGPSSPYSLAEDEDFYFYLNRDGFYAYNGDRPQLISAPIEKQIYNNAGGGIAGTSFDSAPGEVYRHNYYCAVGSVTDDLTDETISNCIEVYDYQLDEWRNYSFAHFPTAFTTYKDEDGNEQMIFGSSTGQCYQLAGTATSDNGSAIKCRMQGFLHFGIPEQNKIFKKLQAFASPGCQAKIQVAITNSFNKDSKKWIDIGSLETGFTEMMFPAGTRGKLMFWRLYEMSASSQFTFYGFVIEGEGLSE